VRAISKAFKSKITNTDLTEKLSPENVRNELMKEQRWKEIIAYFADGPVPSICKNWDQFVLENGVLYKTILSKEHNKIEKKLVVPNSLIDYAIMLAHDSKHSGHAGVLKTFFKTKTLFYFPNMLPLIKEYVSKCILCQKRKTPSHPHRAEMGEIEIPENPLDTVEVDIMQMPMSSASGCKYVLLIIDACSRYLTAYPLKDKSTEEVTSKLQLFVLQHGAMRAVRSDHGKEFTSNIFGKSCELLKSKHLLSIPYRHQTNPRIERSIRTIRDYITLISEQDRLNWEDALPFAIAAYNTSFHVSLNNTPHFIFYGRDHSMPLNEIVDNASPMYLADDNVSDGMAARWKIALEEARKYTDKQNEINKSFYDKNIRRHKIKIGDIVFVKNNAPASKNHERFKGPYRIVSFKSQNMAIIKPLSSQKTIETHTDFLKIGH
jgi:transposase InsO family protein